MTLALVLFQLKTVVLFVSHLALVGFSPVAISTTTTTTTAVVRPALDLPYKASVGVGQVCDCIGRGQVCSNEVSQVTLVYHGYCDKATKAPHPSCP